MTTAKRVYVDMDGVLVDFDRYCHEREMTPDEAKCWTGAYFEMEPIPGAIEAVRELIARGHDVWLATKPPTAVPHALADKLRWVMRHIPELTRKVIFTADKGCLRGDYLIDDRPHKGECDKFEGTFIHLGRISSNTVWVWKEILSMLTGLQKVTR